MDTSHRVFDELIGGDIPQYIHVNATTLTFPEKLMYLVTFGEREHAKLGKNRLHAPIAWDAQGNSITIRNKQDLQNNWLPQFFAAQAKFSSFTRKLYRWGFRRVATADWKPKVRGTPSQKQDRTTSTSSQMMCFHNVYFQRDNKQLLYKMESVTPEKELRKQTREYNRVLLQSKSLPAAHLSHLFLSTDACGGGRPSLTARLQEHDSPRAITSDLNSPNNAGQIWEIHKTIMACQYLLGFCNPAAATAHFPEPFCGNSTTEVGRNTRPIAVEHTALVSTNAKDDRSHGKKHNSFDMNGKSR